MAPTRACGTHAVCECAQQSHRMGPSTQCPQCACVCCYWSARCTWGCALWNSWTGWTSGPQYAGTDGSWHCAPGTPTWQATRAACVEGASRAHRKVISGHGRCNRGHSSGGECCRSRQHATGARAYCPWWNARYNGGNGHNGGSWHYWASGDYNKRQLTKHLNLLGARQQVSHGARAHT